MSTRTNHGYNYEFKCLMEGIEVKFISATIVCNPNGSEATVNIHSTKEAFDLKPKTAIQIFYREWWVTEEKKTWRLLFDGFMSRFDKRDSVQEGAGIAVTCRDFRMDIRKTPCAVVFGGQTGTEMLGTRATYNGGGIYGNIRIPGTMGASGDVRVFDYTGLADIFYVLSLVAGTAQNLKAITKAVNDKEPMKAIDDPATARAKAEKASDANSVEPSDPDETMDLHAAEPEKASQLAGTSTKATNTKGKKGIPTTPVSDKAKASASAAWKLSYDAAIAGGATKDQASTIAQKASNDAVKSAQAAEKATASSKPKSSKPTKAETKANYSALFDAETSGAEGTKSKEWHWFLDALIKGIWLEAAGGTYMGQFLNRRIRADKRLAAMKNEAGYQMFMQQANMQGWGANYAMGNARFTSIEAMIMRIAGLFMDRPAAICNPPLLDLNDEEQRQYFVSQRVYDNYVTSPIYGQPYMAPFTILTPPLEFTAPPNCNVFLPAVYDNVSWQHDDDAEITRGYFSIISSFPSNESSDCFSYSVQVPNTLLNYGGALLNYGRFNSLTVSETITVKDKSGKSTTRKMTEEERAVAAYNAYCEASPSISLDERYKGVNIMTGSVSDMMARKDLARHIHKAIFNAKKAAEVEQVIGEIEMVKAESGDVAKQKGDILEKLKAEMTGNANIAMIKDLKAKYDEISKRAISITQQITNAQNAIKLKANVTRVMERHATVKFINQKFAGRVAQVSMQLNPFPICGFPGVVVADYRAPSGEQGFGFQTRKSMVGTVQQLQHTIHASGAAQTAVVMNNARYIDEPTSMSIDGLPTFMKATDPDRAEFNISAMKYTAFEDDEYFVGDDKPKYDYLRQTKINAEYGVDIKLPEKKDKSEHIYAKDFTTVSQEGMMNGQSNLCYIDQEYAPNLISRFYVKCLKQDPRNSLMIAAGEGQKYYMLDSIHEAVSRLESRADLMYDYQAAFEFMRRDVVSYAGLYCGIMDLALVNRSTGEVFRPVTREDMEIFSTFDAAHPYELASMTKAEYDEYYKAATTTGGADVNVFAAQFGSHVPADPRYYWSSIIDHTPKTAFIIERRREVLKYKQSIEPFARGVKYAYD